MLWNGFWATSVRNTNVSTLEQSNSARGTVLVLQVTLSLRYARSCDEVVKTSSNVQRRD